MNSIYPFDDCNHLIIYLRVFEQRLTPPVTERPGVHQSISASISA